MLNSRFRRAFELNRAYLRRLDADRLLHTFRINAGLPSSAEPLGGWEAPDGELRGHSLGHYLSACALTCAAEADDELSDRVIYLVGQLATCQESLGIGFLSAWPESFIDRVEACERVWAPYYTLHKILAGLLDVYTHLGTRKALDIVLRKCDWLKRRTDRLDEPRMQRMLDATEQGGMNEVLSNVYAITRDPEHLDLARRFNQKSYMEPLQRREDRLKGQHSNSYIPNVIGFARQYELTGEDRFRHMVEFFWNQVVGARSYVTGGTSNDEIWPDEPNVFASQIERHTHETCCTYNLLKLTRHLYAWTGDTRYADYYEHALLNGILPTIDPASGMTMYYVPMESGLFKTFGTPFDSFWCCTGTGMESHAKYAEGIYGHNDTGLFVNLFVASELQWQELGLTVSQETTFPDGDSSVLTFRTASPQTLALRVRVPGWARGASVLLNGAPQTVDATPGTYVVLDREWRDGDRVDFRMPMRVKLRRLPDDPHLAAFVHGPVVLAGAFGREGLDETTVYGQYAPAGYPVPVPGLVLETDRVDTVLETVDQASHVFHTRGIGRPADVVLAPFYATFERYALYWHVGSEADLAARSKALASMTAGDLSGREVIDRVSIGDDQSERDHDLRGERAEQGVYLGRGWRQAIRGGWFSYVLCVLPDAPVTLVATYWGADAGGRRFDILVDGVKIASEELDHKSPGQFVDVEYRVPESLTAGKHSVTVTFQAHIPNRIAGGVFGLCVANKET